MTRTAVDGPLKLSAWSVRRWATASALALVAAALAAWPQGTAASRIWCRTDSVVLLCGEVGVEYAPRIVSIVSPGSAEGTADRWVSHRTDLKRPPSHLPGGTA